MVMSEYEWGDDRLPGRFWEKVDPDPTETGCWEWTASADKDGYGQFWWDGETRQAHRVAYSALVGPIPEGHPVVRHGCDNPPCVNPAHLELGTSADNSRDMVERGRMVQQKRTHCPRDHALAAPNLMPSQLRRGKRECLACNRGRSYVRVTAKRGITLDPKTESDRHYALIMEGSTQ